MTDRQMLETALRCTEICLNNLRVMHQAEKNWRRCSWIGWKPEGKERRTERLKKDRLYTATIKKIKATLLEMHVKELVQDHRKQVKKMKKRGKL